MARQLLVGALILLSIAALGTFIAPSTFASCGVSPYDRKSNPDVTGTAWIPHKLRVILVERAVQLYWTVFLAWSLYRKQHGSSRILYFALWFPGIAFIEWATRLTPDMACSSRAVGNGISGHYFYFAWSLSSLVLFQKSLPTPFWPTFLVMGMLYAMQGSLTWIYGYHSLRQCVIGAAFGIFFAVGSMSVSRVLQ